MKKKRTKTSKKKGYEREWIDTNLFRRCGRYEAFVTAGGKTVQVGTFKTIAAAKSAQAAGKAELEKNLEAGIPNQDKKKTFREQAEDWFGRKNFRPSTARSIRSNLDRHLLPALGRHRLVDLHLSLLETIAATIAPNHSPKTRRNLLEVVRRIMKDAFDRDLIHRDPTEKLEMPKVQSKPVQAVRPELILQVAEVMKSPYREATKLALFTGVRMGELLAIRWSDISDRKLRIERSRDQATGIELDSPKTENGFRDIPLSQAAVDLLAAYKKSQRSEYARLRTECEDQLRSIEKKVRIWLETEPIRFAERNGRSPKAWNRWISKHGQKRRAASLPIAVKNMRKPKMTADGRPASRRYVQLSARLDRINALQFERYVFVDFRTELSRRDSRNPDRLPVIDPHNLGVEFRRAAKSVAGKKRITFHQVRHVFASMLLREGGAKMIPALSNALGHGSASFTLARYVHFIEGDEDMVRSAIDRAVGVVVPPAKNDDQN